MEQKVIDYFDNYFDGQLNESTTDEQLEQAALDLVILTEEVIEFYESVYSAAHKLASMRVHHKTLKRPAFGIPITPKQFQRSANRKVVGQTDTGTELLKSVDKGRRPIKSAEKELRKEFRKDPAAIKRGDAKRGFKYGKSETKETLKTIGKEGQRVHTAQQKARIKPKGSAERGLLGIPLGTKKVHSVMDLDDAYDPIVNHETSKMLEYNNENGDISSKYYDAIKKKEEKEKEGREKLPPGTERAAKQTLKGQKETRVYADMYKRRKTAGKKQGSLMVGARDLGVRAKSITDKGAREVEAETKRARTSSGSIMDIIKKHPELRNRFEKGGTRRERETRGQGRLF